MTQGTLCEFESGNFGNQLNFECVVVRESDQGRHLLTFFFLFDSERSEHHVDQWPSFQSGTPFVGTT